MKYPFERTNYGHDFINSKDKDIFLELKRYVNNYEEDNVNEWFSKHKEILKIKGKNNLAKAIGNYTYYFSLGSGFMSLDAMEALKSQQYQLLLKHFKFEDQAIILTQEFDLSDIKVIETLYKTAKKENKKEKFFNSRIFLDIAQKIFSKENFDKIEELEIIIEKKIHEIQVNKVAFYYQNGASYYGNLKNKYAITDEIILNYTDDKRDFLLNRDIQLPSKNYALQLLEDINQNYKEREFMSLADNETLEQLSRSVNFYYKKTMYIELEKKLEVKNKEKKNKI